MQLEIHQENQSKVNMMAAVRVTDRHVIMVAKKLPHTAYDILGIHVLGLSSIDVENACPQVKSEFLSVLSNLQKYLNKSGADIDALRERCQSGVDNSFLSDRVMQEFQGRS